MTLHPDTAPDLSQEAARLKELYSLNLLDTEPEASFDELAQAAAQICGTPRAAIAFLDRDRVWFKSTYGSDEREIPRSISFCDHIVRLRELLVIEDIHRGSPDSTAPWVAKNSQNRFFAGAPIFTSKGFVIGVLCVIGPEPKSLTATQKELLEILSRQVTTQIELRRSIQLHETTLGELEFQKSLLTAVNEASPDGIIAFSKEGKTVCFNQKVLKIWGFENRQEIDVNLEEVIEQIKSKLEDPHSYFSTLAALDSLETIQNEVRLLDGRTLGRYSGPIRYGQEDQSYGRVMYFRDLTQAKRIEYERERALKGERFARALAEEQSRRQRELFSKLPALAAASKGPSHVFEFANQAYLELVGSRDIVGKPIRKALPELDQRVIDILDQVYQTGERFIAKELPMKADWEGTGQVTQKYFTLIYEPTRGPSGKVEGIWTVAFDVSHTKELETRLAFSERLASLGTLAAGVAHEINNPLAYILSNLELMKETLTSGRISEHDLIELKKEHASIRSGIDRIHKIIRDLKAFSRAENESDNSCDLLRALDVSIAMASHEIQYKAQIKKEYQSVSKIRCDENRIGQVFLNILINAAQAIPESKPSLNMIRIKTYDFSESQVAVEISDTGTGMPQETVKKIFDPFFTTKPLGVGTGLGLSVCHGIIQAAGGEIRVDSTPGVGTTFTILLPKTDLANSSQAEPEKSDNITHVRRARILMIDDELEIAEACQALLRKDHDVEICSNPKEGLNRILTNDYDVIICDLMMADLTGMDIYEETKRLRPQVLSKIIFSTGGAYTPRAVEFLNRIPNPALEKPYSKAALLASISNVWQTQGD